MLLSEELIGARLRPVAQAVSSPAPSAEGSGVEERAGGLGTASIEHRADEVPRHWGAASPAPWTKDEAELETVYGLLLEAYRFAGGAPPT